MNHTILIAAIDYLPAHKQTELREITKLLVEEMHPAMVLLFGSYARNTWAEEITQEEGINLEFKSDYDLLIVTAKDLGIQANNRWMKTQQKIKSLTFSTSVSLIQHSAGYINKELKAGGYFFTDVIREAKVLYDSGEVTLEQPGNVDPVLAKERGKDEFERWVENANNFLKGFNFYYNDGLYKNAAFELHQATESFYTAILLLYTGYKGKSHDIEELGKQVSNIRPEFTSVFPMDTKENIERFHKLKRAYIDARYKKGYVVSKEDLEYLSERIGLLKQLVNEIF